MEKGEGPIVKEKYKVKIALNGEKAIQTPNIDAMADAIYGLLNYDALSEMFIKHGKEEVDNLKWENSASQVKDIYLSVL